MNQKTMSNKPMESKPVDRKPMNNKPVGRKPMDKKAMYKLSYGLCLLAVREGDRDNACVVNTAIQAASEPNQLAICVNKANFTHDMLARTKKFTISILDRMADLEIFRHFGFQSGRDRDKFKGFTDCARGENGLYYITKSTNAYISVRVEHTLDLGSHTLFVGEVTAMEVLGDVESMTYDYYIEHVKEKPEAIGQTPDGRTIWRCSVCGYEYVGEEIPEDFICPTCHHTAFYFEKV